MYFLYPRPFGMAYEHLDITPNSYSYSYSDSNAFSGQNINQNINYAGLSRNHHHGCCYQNWYRYPYYPYSPYPYGAYTGFYGSGMNSNYNLNVK